MRIYPAPHYTMGGLWVDYELMTTVPGLYCTGEANFSDHGANRLGASALMQGLADGYFVLPNTISELPRPAARHQAGAHRPRRVPGRRGRGRATASSGYLAIGGTRSPDCFHHGARQDHVGLLRHGAHQAGPGEGPVGDPGPARGVPEGPPGHRSATPLNQTLEKAGRVDDFFELAQADVPRRPHREESCGGHFRAEHQTDEGEAQRDDEHFAYVAAWEWTGDAGQPDPPQGSRSSSRTSSSPSGATSSRDHDLNLTLKVWRQDGPGRRRPLRHHRRPRASTTRCRSSRCSTSSTSASSTRARSRSSSTTTAARASAARAR